MANSPKRGDPPIRPLIKQIEQEEYRRWLIELLRPHQVILITARPNRYQEVTLARIKGKCGWEPMDAYFAEISSRPHMIKEHLLKTYILPKYGEEGSGYFGLESNPHAHPRHVRPLRNNRYSCNRSRVDDAVKLSCI